MSHSHLEIKRISLQMSDHHDVQAGSTSCSTCAPLQNAAGCVKRLSTKHDIFTAQLCWDHTPWQNWYIQFHSCTWGTGFYT